MSDEDSDGGHKKVEAVPVPEHKIRFTDMPDNLVEKAIRSKCHQFDSANPPHYSSTSIRQRNIKF